MSMQINNGIANIYGTPGAASGFFSNIPAPDNVAEGTLYFATDTLAIYQVVSGGWVNYSGGGGGVPGAANGISYDGLNYVLGGVGSPLIYDTTINANNHSFTLNQIKVLEFSSFNLTKFTLFDGIIKSQYNGDDIGFNLDFQNRYFQFGEFSSNFNGTSLFIDDSSSLIKTQFSGAEIGIKLDFANDVYKFGDWNAISNGNYIEIDNFNNSFYCFTQILELNAQWSGIRGAVGVTKIGDLGFNNNGTFCGVDDVNETLIFSTNLKSATAGGSAGQHLKININGTDYKIALLNP